MRKILILVLIVSLIGCMLILPGCGKQQNVAQLQNSPFNPVADNIQKLSKELSADFWTNGKYLNTIYTSRDLFLQTKQARKYEIKPDLSLEIPREDDHGALFASGYTAIKRYVMDEIDLTVPLDSIWKNTHEKFPEVLEQYYIHRYSLIRVYPFRNLAGIYSPRQNLMLTPDFKIAQQQKGKSARVIWLQPQWDPYFKQMVIKGLYPIRDGNELIGVLGCKVSLGGFLKACTEDDSTITGIICRKGNLVMANPSFYSNFTLTPPMSKEDRPVVFNSLNLNEMEQPHIKSLLSNIINSPYMNFNMKIDEVNYYVECRLIPEMNWVIFKMNKR